MGIELPEGMHDPTSERSARLQIENANRARANRLANNRLDGCLISGIANFVLIFAGYVQYIEIANRIENQPLAIGLGIGAYLVESIILNSLINYAVKEDI